MKSAAVVLCALVASIAAAPVEVRDPQFDLPGLALPTGLGLTLPTGLGLGGLSLPGLDLPGLGGAPATTPAATPAPTPVATKPSASGSFAPSGTATARKMRKFKKRQLALPTGLGLPGLALPTGLGLPGLALPTGLGLPIKEREAEAEVAL